MSEPEKSSRTPRFDAGAKVRVKYGVTVPGFDDIPLGGWTGTIEMVEQVDDQIDYEVEWDRRTLDAMHPVYRKRCERDDLEPETMWLTEEDVEPDDGIPVPIEQPTKIVTPPLSEGDRDDRVRKALGLTHDDPLPEVGHETLLAYHRYLAARLKFPLFTTYWGESGPFSRKKMTVTITGLLDPGGDDSDEGYGLLCRGLDRDEQVELPLDEVEVNEEDPNFRLVTDYSYWFHDWR
jgi:hypothetical protein